MSGNGSTEETEEAISQHLQDLGMLEDGMTTDDKRNLWAVIKISQDTAKAEEQNRQKQARQALQFDQVSSRSESSSGSEAKSDSLIEEIIFPSDHHKEDKATEDEKKPTVAAVLPQQCATPLASAAPSQRATATVLPLCRSHEDDLSQDQNTVNISLSAVSSCSKSPMVVVSHSKQVGSATQDSQALPRCVAEPSVRRGLRPRTNIEMKKTANTESLSLSGPADKERHEPQTVPGAKHVTGLLKLEESFRNSVMTSSGTRTVTGPSRASSSPVPVVESSEHSDEDILESSVSNVQESSLVKKVQNSLSMSNYRKSDTKERIGDKSEVNEDCCERNDFSALKEEQTEEMDMEKCARVSSTVDNVPSPSSDSLSNITSNCNSSRDVGRKGSEDRERNINPFDCDRSNYERTLKVRKVRRTCSRMPFYIPPYRMDIHTYITYFKRSINEQAARLIEVQRRNPRCVPWGEPIVAEESSSRVLVTVGWGEQKSKSLANPQRSNLQDRRVAYQREHTIYEDPDMQSDEDLFFTDTRRRKVFVESQQDDTDDLFDALLQEEKATDKREDEEGSVHNGGDNSHNFTSVSRQGPVKRKSDSSTDQIFDDEEKSSEPQQKQVSPSPWIMAKKEEAPPVAVKRKKPDQDGGMDGEAGAFDDLDSAAGVASDSNSCQETEIIRPGPVKLRRRGRRLFHQSKVETKEHEETENKENNDARMDDITEAYEVGSGDVLEQDAEVVPCPICRKTFLVKDIEAHASECNEYCEEIPPDELNIFESSSSPEMAAQSSEGAISEKCWSEFDSKKEFEGDHVTIFRTRQPRPQGHQGTAASKHTSA